MGQTSHAERPQVWNTELEKVESNKEKLVTSGGVRKLNVKY